MSSPNITLPSKPKIIKEDINHGIFEIDGLYPGYGHTLGNSLRRIILSSIPGAAITSIKIEGVDHEFSTIKGVQEDVISMILNLKKVKFKIHGDEPVVATLEVKGPKVVDSSMIKTPTQAEVVNTDEYLFEITENVSVNIEITLGKGIGFVTREMISKNKAEIGSISLDASYTPVRRASYEVENMRVGDRTDHNKLRINIETDGTISAKEVFERSVSIMINQLQSIVGFKEFSDMEEISLSESEEIVSSTEDVDSVESADENNGSKTKIEDLNLSTRTINTLIAGGVKTLAGLVKKNENSLRELDGMGDKGIEEIKNLLAEYGHELK